MVRRIFDPACGSGGMFVESAHFVAEHKASPGAEISIHGQERVAETVRLARMNRRQSSGEAKPIGCFCGESGGSSRALT